MPLSRSRDNKSRNALLFNIIPIKLGKIKDRGGKDFLQGRGKNVNCRGAIFACPGWESLDKDVGTTAGYQSKRAARSECPLR